MGVLEGGKLDAARLQAPFSWVQLISLVTVFSMLGALIRLEIGSAANYDLYSAYGTLYANVVGCIIMGSLSINKAWLICHHYALYIGLGVGMCGSLTSFSSWQTEAVMALVDWPTVGGIQGVGDQVVGSMTIQLVGVATATSSLVFGMLANQAIAAYDYEFDAPKPPSRATERRDMCVLAAAAVVCVVLLAVNFAAEDRESYAYTCLFAPAGALLRFHLSIRLNKHSWFPWGTFAANMVGCTVLGVATVVQDAPGQIALSTTGAAVVSGVASGFCGSLSTVSTWVSELRALSTVPHRALRYGFASIVWAQLILLAILGTYRWEHGVSGG